MPLTSAGRAATERRRFKASQQLIHYTCPLNEWSLYCAYVDSVWGKDQPKTFKEWSKND